MSAFKYIFVFLLLLMGVATTDAQDTLQLGREQSEALFLQENLHLLAAQFSISQAEAMVKQAKLWPNPTFEIDEVNLWAGQKQLAVFGDELQGFNGGDFGRNQQISASLEQMIQTAGKRRKLVALEQVSIGKSKEYFEELLRNLKLDFRNQLTNFQYLQHSNEIYQAQLASIQKLTASYQKQMNLGNIAKGEYIRLKALELEIAKDINDLQKELNEAEKELKNLMNLPSSTKLLIEEEGFFRETSGFAQLSLNELMEQARENRPDFKLAALEEEYYDKLHSYEKAKRIPDITTKAGYDRGGNFMYNFVGFGLAIDLPIFDRNQGNVLYAKYGMEQSKLLFLQKERDLENETVQAYSNLRNAINFRNSIEEGYEEKLDELLKSYTRNFTERNISLLEYIDFMDAYLENKKIILQAGRELNEQIEELNYTVGTDVIN